MALRFESKAFKSDKNFAHFEVLPTPKSPKKQSKGVRFC